MKGVLYFNEYAMKIYDLGVLHVCRTIRLLQVFACLIYAPDKYLAAAECIKNASDQIELITGGKNAKKDWFVLKSTLLFFLNDLCLYYTRLIRVG